MDKAKHYSGQVLAVVLIVLVVAAIIALAVISRVQSERRGVTQEGSADQSLSVSQTVLTGLTHLPVKQLAEIINADGSGALFDICKADRTSYDFWDNGCQISGVDGMQRFMDALGDDYVSSIAEKASADLANSCQDTEDILIDISPIQLGDEFNVPEGQLYSIMLESAPADASCKLDVTAKSLHDNVEVGMTVRKTYFNDSLGYKNYESSDIQGYCLFDCSGNSNWSGISPSGPLSKGWINGLSGPVSINGIDTIVSSQAGTTSGTFTLDELRILPLKGDISLSVTTNPSNCVRLMQTMRMRVSTSCGGVNQAKEVLVPRENWAPAIFEYVLYNGEGDLVYNPL